VGHFRYKGEFLLAAFPDATNDIWLGDSGIQTRFTWCLAP